MSSHHSYNSRYDSVSSRVALAAVLLLLSIITGSLDVSAFQGRRGRICGRIRTCHNQLLLLSGKNLLSSSSSSTTELNAIIPMPHHFEFIEAANAAATTTAFPLLIKAKLQSNAPAVLQLKDYAPAAASLFNNIKLPAAVVTAGMISLGFATSFPTLPKDTSDRIYAPQLRERCESLNRLHIVVALVSVTSELICVIWAAVEVNQLTERLYEPALSVWNLIQRDCDLAWSGVNSHFVIGIIGFVTMLAIRAYVMLIAASASNELMISASSGTVAALSLMISIVNRGVEAGGGGGVRYGSTVFDLFQHYAQLLLIEGANVEDPGPLQLLAIFFELVSLVFILNVLLYDNGRMENGIDESNSGDGDDYDDELCPVIDIDENHIYASMIKGNNNNVATDKLDEKSKKEILLAQKCFELNKIEEEKEEKKEETKRKNDDDQENDSSVNIL